MKVKCTTHAGISILNAISSGFGCSMAIDLPLSVTVERSKEYSSNVINDELIKAVILKMKEDYNVEGKYRVEVYSEIPPSRGLKSSSALSSALTKAIAVLEGLEVSDEDLLRTACKASIEAGVSITGAYDDACASFFGGIILTDNYEMKIIKKMEADEKISVIIAYSELLPKSKVNAEAYEVFKPIGLKLKEIIESGDIYEAMIINGMLTASAQNIDQSLSYEAMKLGAIAAGVTGTGPAIAILCNEDLKDELVSLARRKGYNVIITRPTNKGCEVVKY